MNNSTIDEIRSVLRDKWWSEDNVRDDSDIFETLVLVGDDCVEFMDKFSERFDVNLD